MLLKLICLFVILYIGKHFSVGEDDLPEVDTPLGRVRGFWKTSFDGRKHAAFEGIPFAKPPIGDLRFEDPQPISPWSGVWEADTHQTCLQGDLFGNGPKEPAGHEDCLYINVYVPAEFLQSSKQLDVLVSIHGGAFMVGSGHTLAESKGILDRDVVLVSFNYRLGILGFLSTEDDVIPGNYGMKDQVLALKWVKDNIASFGGNPHSVTIIGLSAGGASVHLHYFSPLSKGLFVRGVSQSGTALAPWAIRRNALQSARKLAALVGCPDTPTDQLKRCLKQKPARNLLLQLDHFFGPGRLPFSPFAPVVEQGVANAFLDKEPYLLLKQGNVLDVPWITSYTANDGLLPTAFFWPQLDKVNENWVEMSPYVLDYNDTLPVSKKESIAQKILEYYLGSGEEINKENFKKFTQIFTERLFGIPAEQAAKMQAKINKSPVYFYLFNYGEGENNVVQFYARTSEVEGVAHGEDGVYFYGIFNVKPFSEKDKQVRSICQDILYTFASTGKPSFGNTDAWLPVKPDQIIYLNITNPESIVLQSTDSLTSGDFWNQLGLLENEDLNIKDEL